VDGLKTGFTNGAGFCLSATAQRNGRRLIVVIMGSPDSNTRDLKVSEFLERGFASLPAAPPPPPPASDSPIRPATSTSRVAPSTPAADAPPSIKFSIPKK
jgi:D-alanyl-D-alanine carboxypeptidase (penicillin-binding protein 5/6)